ncbi:hypothetical protein [Solitalea canadensis]|uniref:Uncharacterized protein n=1 Tax=Solitalea canadensis (strain ATCC 29591 / DSM 3403 / JCM 21819 / LMG 8368 / NBRC 15130 / NCIMB 12057 / USAM 9D) TaxID=929556 RepID=H8KPU3_SOLCM|nr:hypothetical protein [Solitalea canadensis]AFD05991.1 hypothetical protein Solca_0876 [Solitalea canadensis DSM 3403]
MIQTNIEPTENNLYKVTVRASTNPATFVNLRLTDKSSCNKTVELTNTRPSKASALQAAERMKQYFMRTYFNSVKN